MINRYKCIVCETELVYANIEDDDLYLECPNIDCYFQHVVLSIKALFEKLFIVS